MTRLASRERADSAPGLGLDIIEIDRVERIAKGNPRFLRRVFSSDEIRYCRSKKRQWQHVAARFAAKEAVWKAVGSSRLSLKDISISRSAEGRPGVLIRGRRAPYVQLSLSHGDHYALAVAMAWPPKNNGRKWLL